MVAEMADVKAAQAGLAQAIARFPAAALTLRRLALTHPDFLEICEEYGLAQESLTGFEARPDAAERPEIGDYRRVIAELEAEIGQLLAAEGRAYDMAQKRHAAKLLTPHWRRE